MLAYPGEFVTVEVTETHDYDHVGKVVAREEKKGHQARASMPASVRGGERLVAPPTWLAPR